MPRQEIVSRAVRLALLFACVLAAPRALWGSDLLANPLWHIYLSDAGYSDGMFGPQGHEQLSGEWAAAVRYDGIANGESMWLEPQWICPDWISNSQFAVIEPFVAWDDAANPIAGPDTGHSRITNGEVEISIDAVMRDGFTVMGLAPGVTSPNRVTSYRYVMVQTYTIKNVTAQPLTHLAFYQLMHPHPNDDYGPNNYGVYDPSPYGDASDDFADYHHDLTFFAPFPQWQPYLDDIVGFSSPRPATAYHIGSFRSPGCGGGEPGVDSLHRLVQADGLAGVNYDGPDEIAGAAKWHLGTLDPGEAVSVPVLFSTSHTDFGLAPEVVPPAPVIAYIGDTEGCPSAASALAARLSDEAGNPIPGKSVQFVIGDQTTTAETDGSGVAAISVQLQQSPGSYMVTASFLGDSEYGGALDSTDFSIEECANEAPDCGNAAPNRTDLWPPNHKFVEVAIEGVSDPDGDEVAITVTGIAQDEPLKVVGAGNTCPDGAGVGTSTAMLRAERSGTPKVPGNGRVYHVNFTAADGKGGECSGTVRVCVPHDQRSDPACVDEGPLVNSTGPCS